MSTPVSATPAPRLRIDVKAVVEAGMARLHDLRGLLDHGTIEEQKTVVQSFVQRIELSAKNNSLAAYFYALPTNCSFDLVAGARYEPLQIEMRPIERFVAGLRRVA